MRQPPTFRSPQRSASWPSWLAWALGAVSLLPVIVLAGDFSQLFWFGDEWDLLAEIERMGFWTWTWQAFAENFVPLFKLLWYGLVVAGQGDYRVMIGALWLTHALNVALFGLLLREAGCSAFVAALCLVVFGLTPTNLETLGWSVQWSAVLALTFFLAAAWWQTRHLAQNHAWSWKKHGVLFALSAASALCFSRGVLTGAALAAIALWPVSPRIGENWRGRLRTAFVCLAPALAVAVLITITQPSGGHQLWADGQRPWADMIQYAAWYFGLNPLHRLLSVDSWGWRTTTLLTLVKLALIGWGLWRAAPPLRRLLVLLVILDLGNAALLGIGRYHTGLPTTVSSRYQYASLICTLPFVALWMENTLHRVRGWRPGRTGPAVAVALVVVIGWFTVRHWRQEAAVFTSSRGQYTRHLLLHDPAPPPEGAMPGIPYLKTERAKELMRRYHLH